MQIRVCRYKNVGVAGYAEAFIPVQSDSQTSKGYRCSVTITDSSDPGIFPLYFPGTRKYICASLADALIFATARFFSRLIAPLHTILRLLI